MRGLHPITTLMLICAFALTADANARGKRDDAFHHDARLVPADGARHELFGYHFALSGDGRTLAAGAAGDDHSRGIDAGSVFVFTSRGDQWSEEARLEASDGAAGDLFGICVALSPDGNTLAVGAHFDDHDGAEDAGSVYLFARRGGKWIEDARLQASDAAAGDHFGTSVAFDGDAGTLAVGAHYDDHPGAGDAGSVYVFERRGSVWSESARLAADDAAAGDYFGVSVAFSARGDTLAVSAYGDDRGTAADAGSAYVFERTRDGWRQRAHLTASDAAARDRFGTRVSLSANGRTLAAGAYFDDHAGAVDAGSAYIFTESRSGWREEGRLQMSGAAAGDFFGATVALSAGGLLAVGAYGDDHASLPDAGSVVLFRRSRGRWQQLSRLEAAHPAANDAFGTKVAFSGDGRTLAVSASGSVSVFRRR